MTNIKDISDNYLCSACGACSVVCSNKAISLKWSSLGRKYAYIDTNKCSNCGRCLKACPSIDFLGLHKRYNDLYIGNIINTYTGKATDVKIFHNAQSGGACTAIVKHLFDTQKIDCAIMCKMIADKTPIVKAAVIDNANKLYECQKSCYTFVDVLSALSDIKGKNSIAVVGVPCHIEGATLLNEQFKNFSNIKYKIGLICDRTHCKGMQDALVAHHKYNQHKVINWRMKSFEYKGVFYNYQNAPCVILDEKRQILNNGIFPNTYRFVLKDMFTTPRCRLCYDKLNTHADVVVGDPWGMSGIDWRYGESVILTRTELGEGIIKEMCTKNKLNLIKRKNYSEVITGQHIDTKPISREKYLLAYNYLFERTDSYLSVPTLGIADDECVKEFERFLMRENRSYIENQKEAESLLKDVDRKNHPIRILLRKIKKSIVNRKNSSK